MNKEIEEVLKGMRDVSNTEGCSMNLDRYLVKLLLSYIEQLEKENETLGEIVNIKDEQLKEMQMQKTDYTAVNILEAKIKQLENNRDKAIKYIKENASYGIQEKCCMDDLNYDKCDELLDILKGDSDE